MYGRKHKSEICWILFIKDIFNVTIGSSDKEKKVIDFFEKHIKSAHNINLATVPDEVMNGGSGGVVNNYYNNDNSCTVNQTNNSPKSLSRLDIYRMTRNALNV